MIERDLPFQPTQSLAACREQAAPDSGRIPG